MSWLKNSGYQDWSQSYLFHPTQNPVPFPKPGQRSGLFGWVYANDASNKEHGTDDLDELMFLVENDYDLYQLAMKQLGPKHPEILEEGFGAIMPVKNHPDVVQFLRRNFGRFTPYVYETYGPAAPEPGHEDDPFYQKSNQWSSMAKEVIRIIKAVYGDEQGPLELEKFMSRLKPGEREDFEEEAVKDPWVSFMEGFSDAIDQAKGKPRLKPSPKVERTVQDVPSLSPEDIQTRKDQILDQFNSGQLDEETFQKKMDEMNRMGFLG